MERKIAPEKGPECLGRWCPSSLEKINHPGFVIRGGIILYVPSTTGKEGKILLGMKIKNKKYTDFGGGCKTKKGETPFECAKREFLEETLGVVANDLKNITHILITGTKQPHQVVLMVKVDSLSLQSVEKDYASAFQKARNPELSGIKVVSLEDFMALTKYQMAESIYVLRSDVERIVRGEKLR